MTLYTVTAWCDRTFRAQCEVEAETPREALEKARAAIDDAPAEECDGGYPWDEWRVDPEEADGVLLHQDEEVRLRGAAPKLLESLQMMVRWAELHGLTKAELITGGFAEVPVIAIARAAIAEATGGAA